MASDDICQSATITNLRKSLINHGCDRWPIRNLPLIWKEAEKILEAGRESAHENAEKTSETLFDIARSAPLRERLEYVLSHRVVPLRTRVIPARREEGEGTALQDQMTYMQHFPPTAYAVSIIIPQRTSILVEAAPYPGHGKLLDHQFVSDRVWGAQLSRRQLADDQPHEGRTIRLAQGEALAVTSYFCHTVPLMDVPVISFDYRTSPYRQALNPIPCP
jgi:hypothetical protein